MQASPYVQPASYDDQAAQYDVQAVCNFEIAQHDVRPSVMSS